MSPAPRSFTADQFEKVSTMANERRGEVEVSTGDKTMILCLDANVICALEEKFQVETITDLAERVGKKPAMRDLRTIVHEALLRKQPDATELDAGDVLSELGLKASVDLIVAGLGGVVGARGEGPSSAKGGKGSRPPKAAAITGPRT